MAQLTLPLLLQVMQAKVFREGPITVDNQQHPKLTSVRVAVALEVEGALLKVTSALTNSGCTIQEGDIQVSLFHWIPNRGLTCPTPLGSE